MSRTLLYTVQRVLEKLDLDVVNSINDSQDAILIAREAEDTFYDLISRNEWPERYDIINVESVGDTNNPTALKLPNNVINVESVRYNVTESGDTDTTYKALTKLDPESFMDMVYERNSSDSNVTAAVYKGMTLYVINDQPPEYFTTFDNEYIVLDSFDNEVETTVQGTNSVVRASSAPTFESDDDFVIPFDTVTYPLYLAELTAAASTALNGTQDIENERRRIRGISRLRRSAYRAGTPDHKNYFGRNGTGRS